MAACSDNPSRRAVLLSALAAATVAGCGGTGGGGARSSASSSPDPAIAVLSAAYQDCVSLGRLAGASGGDLGPGLAAIHDSQAQTIRILMIRAGAADPDAPTPTPSASSSTSANAATTGTPSPSASPTGASLARAEAQAAARTGVEVLDDQSRVIVASIRSQHLGAARLLGEKPKPLPRPQPITDLSSAIAATAEAVWMFEYIAARSSDADRARARASRDALKTVLAEQHARSSTHPSLPFGYARPRSSDPTTLAVLADSTLSGIKGAYGTHLSTMSTTTPNLAAITSWLAVASVQGHAWEQPLEAFPGLAEPEPVASASPSPSVQQ